MSASEKYEFILRNLSCPNCANKIQEGLSKNSEFTNVMVNYNTTKLSFETTYHGDVKKFISAFVKTIEAGIKVELVGTESTPETDTKWKSIVPIARIVIGSILMILTMLMQMPEIFKLILIIMAYTLLLYRTFLVAINKIFKYKTLDENTLITISVLGAFMAGQDMEGFMVIFLYEIGKILEEKAVNKSRKSIKDLMNIRPEYANVKVGNNLKKVSPEEVKIDDIIVIKAGEKIALDGVVISGTAELDTAALTGESKWRTVKIEDVVLSGSINVEGLIEVQVTKNYKESTVSKILELVENATDRKAKTETFVSKVAKFYTPIVLILAILVAIFLPLVIKGITYAESTYRALIFLVISCPCAIAISVPLSYFSGIGRASKSGILIKGSDYLDSLRNVRTIVFDKTGTLTTGGFHVSSIVSLSEDYSEEEILRICANRRKLIESSDCKSNIKKIWSNN